MCILHPNDSDSARKAGIAQMPSPDTTALKLWEIDLSFRCPVIGMCLTLSEQKHMLKKAGFSLKNKSPYDIHEILVAGAESENRLSQKVDRLLNHKYGRRAEALHHLAEQDFLCCWKDAFETGQYLTEFWAAVSRRDLSVTSKKEIFGAIHMAMHANADQTARATRRLALLESKAVEQGGKIKGLNLSRRTLAKEYGALTRRLAELKNRLACAEQENGRLRSEPPDRTMSHRALALEQENQRLQAALADQAGRIKAKDRKLLAMTEHIAQLSTKVEEQRQAEVVFKKEAQETLQTFFEMNRCDSECPAFDLCSKRVLIVGGIARMEALYRRLIETSGGFFEYHDGYMNCGAKKLESRLKRADIVLCPVNCNSHAACAMVKNLGKKHNKPVHMLANFSLSAVSQVIRARGAGPATAN
jgi:hypothetical protein